MHEYQSNVKMVRKLFYMTKFPAQQKKNSFQSLNIAVNRHDRKCALKQNPHNIHIWLLPHSPSRDAYTLDDTDTNLGHEHKKEHHEVEGAITPRKKKIKKNIKKQLKIHKIYYSTRKMYHVAICDKHRGI